MRTKSMLATALIAWVTMPVAFADVFDYVAAPSGSPTTFPSINDKEALIIFGAEGAEADVCFRQYKNVEPLESYEVCETVVLQGDTVPAVWTPNAVNLKVFPTTPVSVTDLSEDGSLHAVWALGKDDVDIIYVMNLIADDHQQQCRKKNGKKCGVEKDDKKNKKGKK